MKKTQENKQMNKMNFPSYFECQKAMNKLKSITPKEYKKKFSKEELDKRLLEQQELLQDYQARAQ